MKNQVSDEAVTEYVRRLRDGIPLGKLFPASMSNCDFTERQREIIKRARRERKTQLKRLKLLSSTPVVPEIVPTTQVPTMANAVATPKTKPQSKLSKMLFLQSGRCFFCGQLL